MATETRAASPAHLLVEIQSFSLLDDRGVDKYKTKAFDAGGYKWRLVIYPNGHKSEKAGEYVSVYLAVSDTKSLPENWEVNAVFSIFILNQITGNYHHTPGTPVRFSKLNTKWGFPKFISKANLTTLSNEYLIGDCCLFGAEVILNKNSRGAVTADCLILKDVEVPYKHVIKISDISTLKHRWYSEEFKAEGNKWKISFFRNGRSDHTGRSVSTYLVYVPHKNKTNSCDERVKVCFTICVKNQLDSNKDRKFTLSHWFDASNVSWGQPLLCLCEFYDANGGFIVNDTCLVEVEISVQAVAL